MYKVYFSIILFLSSLLGFDNPITKNIVTNPFYKKQSANYCLNDFSNCPIGIFKEIKTLNKYSVRLDNDSNTISISESSLDYQSLIPYVASLDNYLKDLYINNQKYNFSTSKRTRKDLYSILKKLWRRQDAYTCIASQFRKVTNLHAPPALQLRSRLSEAPLLIIRRGLWPLGV